MGLRNKGLGFRNSGSGFKVFEDLGLVCFRWGGWWGA